MNTQEKQEINTKIEELKKTIAELEAKVNEPEKQPWEPHGQYHVTHSLYGERCFIEDSVSDNVFISEEAAQYAADKLKPIYKLLSYVTEFDKEEYGAKDTCIFKNLNIWVCAKWIDLSFIDQVYMSKRCAEELVDKLNKGLVKLD